MTNLITVIRAVAKAFPTSHFFTMASGIKVRTLTMLSNVIDYAQEQARLPRSKTFQRTTLGGLAFFILV